MIEYKIIKDDDGDPIGCYFCDSEVPLHEFRSPNYGEEEPSFLCKICSSTPAGSAHNYPTQYPGGTWGLMKMMAACTNMILRELQK